jgi:hypothetical protein
MVRAMQRVAVLLAIAACGHDTSPLSNQESATPRKPVESTKAVAKSMMMSDMSAVAGKLDAVGPLAPQPPAPTPDAVRKRVCAFVEPVELGAADDRDVAVAFGPTSGIVAWSPNGHQVAIRAIDRTGKPLGEAHTIEAPQHGSSPYGIRAIDGHYIVFVSGADASGSAPLLTLYALLTDADGVPSARFTQVALGERGVFDDISPGGTRGVFVWALPARPTLGGTGRLISLSVDGKGGLAQSYIDIPDPAPGTLPFARYSFGEHAVAVIGPDVIVDGEVKPRQDDKAYKPDRLELAPTFTGSSVPVLGMRNGRDAWWLRYGTLGLDGVLHFETKDIPKTWELKAPFDDRVNWGVSDTEVDAVTDIGRAKLPTVKMPVAFYHHTHKVVWTGDRVLLVGIKDGKLRTAPLPCDP